MRNLMMLATIVALTMWARSLQATETCGNSADDDANGVADDGCNPTDVTGVCESPLDCTKAGNVSPRTGNLVFRALQPDINVKTPYGPPLVFQRFYASQYAPTYAMPVNIKDPLGLRFQHNYMSWLTYISGITGFRTYVLHTVTGREVVLTETTGDATFYKFNTQVGSHFKSVYQRKSNSVFEITMLDGTSYTYDTNLRLSAVRDSLAAPQSLTVTYNAAGGVDKVTDASTYRYLQFYYFSSGNKPLQYVKLYENTGTPTLWLTVEFTYSGDAMNSTLGKLATVKVGSTTVENDSYDANGYLSDIKDGEGTPKVIAQFKYVTANPGRLRLEHTPDGDVGYTYGDASCDSGNGVDVLFNRATISQTCDVDNDCGVGAGNYCGGKDGAVGSTGWCFAAKRCVSSTTANEHLWKDITVSCNLTTSDRCLTTKHYEWDTSTVTLNGRLSADSIKTSFAYDTNAMVTTEVENDTDYVASTSPAGSRTHYFTYSSGTSLLTETRILSELKPAGTCTSANTTDCKRTIHTYSTDYKRLTDEEIGFTYNSSGTVTAFDHTTTYSFDSKGRMYRLQGPRAGTPDDIEYTFWASGDSGYTVRSKDYIELMKVTKTTTPTYLTTTRYSYNIFGVAAREIDPNGYATCRWFYDYGGLAQTRIVVNGTTDCVTGGGNDENTLYSYDSHRRLTLLTLPRSNCIATSYDSDGRRSVVKEEDVVSSVCESTGNTTNYTYSLDGRLTQTDWKDAAGATTRTDQVTIDPDRRISTEKNPADASKIRTWSYAADGVPTEVQFEDYGTSSARTQWDVDWNDRETALRRYTGASSNEAFALTPGVQLELPTNVADPASKNLVLVWDDLHRKVKETTPEGGTNYYVYDEASNLVTLVMASGTANSTTTAYTYDVMNRLQYVDTGDTACTTSGSPPSLAEIQYYYDAMPSNGSCPSGSTCANLAGHLAAVKTEIYCDGNATDGSFDQWTYYSYGASATGRIAEHTVHDDSARNGRIVYSYDKNGNVTREDYPTGSTTGAVYTIGSGNHSDDDRVSALARDTTSLLTGITWYPFGPVKHIQQANTFNHSARDYNVTVDYARNAAYRVTQILTQSTFSPVDPVLTIDMAEDGRQRYTKRKFTNGSAGQKDMFFLYDNLNRALCRTTASVGSCPASGGANQFETLAYNTSSDRTQLILNNALIASTTYNTTYTSGRINCIRTDGNACGFDANEIAFAWDTRGNRTSDDDKSYATTKDDARTYTYDGRNNLITSTSQFWFSTSTMHADLTTYAYDEANRLIFKSFKDTTANKEAQWFFYYDLAGHVVQAKYTPDINTSSTFSTFYWYWLNGIPVYYTQIDSPSQTESRRFLQSDEQGRPHAAWSWPTSGSSARVWEVEAGLFGWDIPTVGSTVYQPLRFPGQKYDTDTEAQTYDGSGAKKVLRSGLTNDGARAYDSFSAVFLQPSSNPTDLNQRYALLYPVLANPSPPTSLARDNVDNSECYPDADPLGMSTMADCYGCGLVDGVIILAAVYLCYWNPISKASCMRAALSGLGLTAICIGVCVDALTNPGSPIAHDACPGHTDPPGTEICPPGQVCQYTNPAN